MESEGTQRLPLTLTPVAFTGETVGSYAARLDRATASTKHHVWSCAVSEYRTKVGLAPRCRVKQAIAESEVMAFCHELAGNRADGIVLLKCPTRLLWYACLECSSRDVALMHPEHARLVCPVHNTWTGPVIHKARHRWLWAVPEPPQDHSQPVSHEVARAAARIHASMASVSVIVESLRRAASAAGRAWDDAPLAEELPTAAAILETVMDVEAVQSVCDPYRPYSAAYELIRQKMETASNPCGAAGVDQAWLMLRWTAAAARYRWAGEWNAEDPAPVVEPLQLKAHTKGVLQPFDSYLACLSTTAGNQDQQWEDRHLQMANGPRFLCTFGHVRSKGTFYQKAPNGSPYRCTFCTSHAIVPEYNSFAHVKPLLAAQWDPQAPPGPTPWTVSLGSTQIGHWICEKNHRWDASFYNRSHLGSGCPYCNSGRMITGINDFATTHPALAALWDSKAGNLKAPDEFKAGNQSLKIVWRCPRGHRFIRTPANLVRNRGACQVCRGRILMPGKNDLATLRPDVAASWNYQRNGTLTPQLVKPGSVTMVWWVCPDGHEFQQRIINRCKTHTISCPVETGRQLLGGSNDIATREPLLIQDWDYSLNDRRPEATVPGERNYYWTCPAGHTQLAAVRNRRKAGGCSLCPPGQRAIPKVLKLHRHVWDTH